MIPFLRGPRELVGLLLLALPSALCSLPAPGFHAGLSYGFTHYDPDDLNEINRVFEATSRGYGFRGYTVKPFDGHMEQVVGLGLHWKRIWTTLEAEIWEEAFFQREVPFAYNSLSGHVNAEEKYLFVPMVLMFKYPVSLGRLLLTPGYGPGVMFGSASVHIATRFDSVHTNDDLRLSLTSEARVIHRLGCDALYRIKPWLALGVSAGYRISTIPFLEVKEAKGYSYIFNLLFNGGAEPGDRLYLGYETLAFTRESEKRPSHRLAQGEMTGYYLWLRILFEIGAKS